MSPSKACAEWLRREDDKAFSVVAIAAKAATKSEGQSSLRVKLAIGGGGPNGPLRRTARATNAELETTTTGAGYEAAREREDMSGGAAGIRRAIEERSQ